jgi:hypothetical protein
MDINLVSLASSKPRLILKMKTMVYGGTIGIMANTHEHKDS